MRFSCRHRWSGQRQNDMSGENAIVLIGLGAPGQGSCHLGRSSHTPRRAQRRPATLPVCVAPLRDDLIAHIQATRSSRPESRRGRDCLADEFLRSA